MFRPEEAIRFGWEIAKKKWTFFLGLLVLQYVLQNLGTIYARIMNESLKSNNLDGLYYILSFVAFVLGLSMGVGFVKIILKLVDGEEAKYGDLFSKDIMIILKLIVMGIVTGVIVVLGFIFLIVPGLILAVRLSLSTYYLIDKNLGPIEAMKASWNATRGNVWNLFGLGLYNFFVILAGALALLIGLIWAIPTVALAHAYVYKKLSSK